MQFIIYGLGAAFMLFTVLPLLRSSFWLVRVFDYPRFQKFVLTALILLASFFVLDASEPINWLFWTGLLACLVYIFWQFRPYTSLVPPQVLAATHQPKATQFSLLIWNVLQTNRSYQSVRQMANRHQPDLVLLLETDQAWANGVQQLETSYPFKTLVPLENTYGMLLYSKFPLQNTQVKYLVKDDIPSIETEILLRPSLSVKAYFIHPKPPVPQESVTSDSRDKELILVGNEAVDCPLPVIVAGDLNDVAWSETSQLFQRISGLLDVRVGRGFFSTFNAKMPLLRFPLDHVFVSAHFRVAALQLLAAHGSDHFPVLVKLEYEARNEHIQETPEADADDLERAEEILDAPLPDEN